jgi:GAF domain-containing protein
MTDDGPGGDDSMAGRQSDRERRLAEAFVALADTLVTDFDVVELFSDLSGRCVELLDVTAAGLMLADPRGQLRAVASSNEQARLLELLEIQNDEGPCLESHRTGGPVMAPDLNAERQRWPTFTHHALDLGFHAAYALPMRLREESIGALNLFHQQPDALTDDTLRIGQGLADVATIAVLQQRALRRHTELSEQLQHALDSRVAIE